MPSPCEGPGPGILPLLCGWSVRRSGDQGSQTHICSSEMLLKEAPCDPGWCDAWQDHPVFEEDADWQSARSHRRGSETSKYKPRWPGGQDRPWPQRRPKFSTSGAFGSFAELGFHGPLLGCASGLQQHSVRLYCQRAGHHSRCPRAKPLKLISTFKFSVRTPLGPNGGDPSHRL